MRTRVNWPFLGWALAIGLAVTAGVHLLHKVQLRRTAGAVLDQALAAEGQGRLDDAAFFLTQYLGCVPEDSDAWARYGMTLERVGTVPARLRALAAYEEVLRRQPGCHDVRRQLIRVALGLQRFGDVRAHAQVLLRVFPSAGELEEAMARCQEAAHDDTGAAVWFDRAIGHRPHQVEAYTRLAWLYRRLDEPERADLTMAALVAANPQSAQAHLWRGRYQREFVALDAAAEELRRARELAPEDVEVLEAPAEVARLRGQVDEARADLEKALGIAPTAESLYPARAAVEMQAGDNRQAIACLQRGLQVLPERPALLAPLFDLLLA